jgi:hypothetical protein
LRVPRPELSCFCVSTLPPKSLEEYTSLEPNVKNIRHFKAAVSGAVQRPSLNLRMNTAALFFHLSRPTQTKPSSLLLQILTNRNLKGKSFNDSKHGGLMND